MSASPAPLDWDRLEALFEAALGRPPQERAAFLDRECPDPEARAELESLLTRADPAERLFDALAASLEALTSRLGPEEPRTGPDPETETASTDLSAVAPQAPDPLLGTSIGRYRIEGKLGGGGMGIVYRARDTRLEREVALKFLPAHLGLDPDAKERFLVEARAAAALDHPSICTVHEIGETEDGRLFLAMARYEGETLERRIARGPLPVTEAISIAIRIARGLAAAHARGIVHRDVKPGNVMLTADGEVKLLDFGLAKVSDVTITRPGITPGTVAYMSPEQVRDAAVDRSSDLWSLGVVFYEMLTGVRPFRGERDRAVLDAILHEDPEPVEALRPGTPKPIAKAVARLLRKDPSARYATAEELLADLERAPIAGAPLAAGLARALLRSPRRRRALAGVIAILALVATALGTSLLLSRRAAPVDPLVGPTGPGAAFRSNGDPARAEGAAASPTSGTRTTAVLPFVNVGGDPEEEYFSDGLTEELIAALSRLQAVRVVARTSSFAFKGENRDIREIGRALDVATVVEGSVRREGDRVRVAAQLVDAVSGLHLWSATYESRMTDIFELQADLALRIAEALEAELTPAERTRLARNPTENPEAYALYLKGRHLFNRRTGEGLERAIAYFNQAIETDPGYALAYAGLAGTYAPLGFFEYIHPRKGRERMREAAYRAVELDDRLAEAHTVLAAYLHVYEWDAAGAEAEYRRAIDLNANDATAQQWYGTFLRAQGRYEEALAQRRKAVELDPLAAVHIQALGGDFLSVGRPDIAVERFREALELDPGHWQAHQGLGLVHEANGDLEEAIRAVQKAVAHAGPTRQAKAGLARLLALAGRESEARQVLDTLRAEVSVDGIYTPQVAAVLYALGDAEAAFEWLEAAFRQRHPQLPYFVLESGIADLQNDPRLQDLQRRIGLTRSTSPQQNGPG